MDYGLSRFSSRDVAKVGEHYGFGQSKATRLYLLNPCSLLQWSLSIRCQCTKQTCLLPKRATHREASQSNLQSCLLPERSTHRGFAIKSSNLQTCILPGRSTHFQIFKPVSRQGDQPIFKSSNQHIFKSSNQHIFKS